MHMTTRDVLLIIGIITLLITPVLAGEQHFGEGDNGHQMKMNMVEMAVLQLSENPSTGSVWQMVLPEGLVLTKESFIPGKGPGLGVPGIREWRFYGQRPGTYTIQGVNKPGWLPDSGSYRQFTLTLRVYTNDWPIGNPDIIKYLRP